MAKMRRKKLQVCYFPNGEFFIQNGSETKVLQIRAEDLATKFESVRTAILGMGEVFSLQIERKVRRELDYWTGFNKL